MGIIAMRCVQGKRKAERFYVYSALEDFMDEKPMVPFKMKLSNGKKIPAIFIDYYIPKKDWNFITEEQRKFVQMVYDFKDGRVSCSRYSKKHWQSWICQIVLVLYSCHAAIKANTLPDSAG